MTRKSAILMLCAATLGATGAAAEGRPSRLVTDAEAPLWRGVGSLRVAGRPSCTAVLISAIEAITAAHCVVDRKSGERIDPEYFTLVLGQRTNSYAAVRQVTAAAFLPGFVSPDPVIDLTDLSTDLALLKLDFPVTLNEAAPLEVADWPQPIGGFVDIVGYERDGSKTPTIREGCMAIETADGVTVVTCDVITGISGSPVLLEENPDLPPRLVASVSSRGRGAAYVVSIAPRLAELRDLVTQ